MTPLLRAAMLIRCRQPLRYRLFAAPPRRRRYDAVDAP